MVHPLTVIMTACFSSGDDLQQYKRKRTPNMTNKKKKTRHIHTHKEKKKETHYCIVDLHRPQEVERLTGPAHGFLCPDEASDDRVCSQVQRSSPLGVDGLYCYVNIHGHFHHHHLTIVFIFFQQFVTSSTKTVSNSRAFSLLFNMVVWYD